MSTLLPLRLGILAPGDPDSVLTWSGVPHFMTNALREHFRDVIHIPAGSLQFSKTGMTLDKWSRRLFRRGYLPGLLGWDLARRAASVDRLIAHHRVDVVLAITVDQLVAFLQTDVPLVHHSDTTFAALEDYYPRYSSLWAFCRRRGDQYAARTLARADLCTFPSHWAARSAVQDYDTDPAKVHVIPYGANLKDPPPAEDVCVSEPRTARCQLLFMGRGWKRKGGETVFATLLELIRRGIDAHLVAVGSDPGVTHERLEMIPFLNKQVPEDLKRYLRLWRESSFLFMPSRQETFGAVFAEAAANALPVISRRTGGIPDAVEDGVSGYLLPEDAGPKEYADVIERTWKDPIRYQSLMQGARERFERVLNWDAWAGRTTGLIEALLRNRKGQ